LPSFFASREGGRAVIVGGDARHLARSLRARVGEEIEVVDPDGFLLTVRLDQVSPERVEGVIVAQVEHRPEPAARITIAIAQLPAPALELVLSRCTEVGAYGFHVIHADRSIAMGAKSERWNTICREAAMLARRLRVPVVEGPSTLDEVLSAADHPVLLMRGSPVDLADLREPRDITLLVGPEGGWSDRELALHTNRAGLGPRNLRADTAAVVGLAVALAGRRASA
jgi:16S rRNA (uracil1498-N3)-methyltransferase